MKKKLLLMIALMAITLSYSCSKDDVNNDESNNQENNNEGNNNEESQSQCASIQNFTISQNGEDINIAILSTNTLAMYYELSVMQTNSGNNPDYGQITAITELNSVQNNQDIGLYAGSTYVTYVRAVCTDGSKSNWSTPKAITINEICYKPYDLQAYATSLTWDSNYSSNSLYQMQYGVSGFTLGTGTTYQTNNEYYNDFPMQANTTYDFYVRVFCSDTNGWSSWSNVKSYYNQTVQNMCTTPSNVVFYNEGSGYKRAQWNTNGEYNFEYVIGSLSGNINTISSGYWPVFYAPSQTSFYVRAVCANGDKTAWSGPWYTN